ncbi:MAG: sensor histidine kinase N-terminal domain-containing protein, partial [Gammaproteobacteria bacterium]|nr:sensor histidine kinase N-terminal domain-containing protein [Gammaproteobacteria bacterium]
MSLSLRGRLLWRLLPAIAIVWLISAALAAWQTHRQTVQALDANLAQSANIIHALLMHEIVEHATAEHRGSSTHDPSAASGPWLRQIRAHLGPATNLGPLAFQIDTLDGRIELRSPNGPDLGPRPASPGFADVHDHHQGWRVYTRIDSASGIAVRVAEPARHRLALLSAMLRKLLLPLIVSGPLLALLIWLSVGKGLQPLRRIDAVLRERAPTHLAPLG